MTDLYDYSRWPNFTKAELVCKHTGRENPNVEAFTQLMDGVQWLRTVMGVPFTVTSAYRAPEHPDEASKLNGPGQHSRAGIDIQVSFKYYHKLLALAFSVGYTGIGINLKGTHKDRFIHLDERRGTPSVWSY